MIVALLCLMLLAAIGMGLMFMADTENSVNNNYRDSQKAYFAARAGAENVRLQLASAGSLNAQAMGLTMPLAAAGTGMIYVKNPTGGEAIDPTTASGATLAANPYLDDQLCWEAYSGLTLAAGTGGPCGGLNGQSPSQLLPTSTAFTAVTLPTSPGINGSDALAFKWVRVANKQNLMGPLAQKVTPALGNGLQVCWDGTKEWAIAAGTCTSQSPQTMMPVWEITSLAVTPKVGQNPGSRRIVQMEVALSPPITPPGAIAAQAPINLQGKLQVNGYDNCNCTSANTSRPGMTCDGNHMAVYSANGISQSGNATTLLSAIGTGLTTYDANGNVTYQGATEGQAPWPYNVPGMIDNYKNAPGTQSAAGAPWNFSCTGSTPDCGTQAGQVFGDYPTGLPDSPTFPATGGPATVYVPGSVHLSGNASGSGILIIDGDLEVHGGLSFYGLILVKGQITFTGGGSQNINVYGAILAGQDVNAQDTALIDNVGGSFNFHYDSCALKLFPNTGPPKLLATHEVMY